MLYLGYLLIAMNLIYFHLSYRKAVVQVKDLTHRIRITLLSVVQHNLLLCCSIVQEVNHMLCSLSQDDIRMHQNLSQWSLVQMKHMELLIKKIGEKCKIFSSSSADELHRTFNIKKCEISSTFSLSFIK